MCEVIAHMWLQETDFNGGHSQFEKKLKEFEMHNREVREDQTYGDGFRLVKSTVQYFGLERTLKELCKTRKLPSMPTSLANLRL